MKEVDIRKIFAEKNPKLAPYIPGFVYAYLNRILHVDFINYFLEKHGDKRGVEFAKASIQEFNISREIIGFENIPDKRNILFVSNHPLGGFDGMLLISILGEKFPDIKVLVNDILMYIKNMDGVFVPINKHGKQSLEAARIIEEVFSQGVPVLTFPAGLVSRKKNGMIRDPEWKKNFIAKSVQHKRDIIPVYVSGRCTDFFYRIANLRKLTGIRSNIEMFYLPDETYQHRNEHIKVIIGMPIPWQTFNKRLSYSDWAKKIQDYVYTLPESYDQSFKEGI